MKLIGYWMDTFIIMNNQGTICMAPIQIHSNLGTSKIILSSFQRGNRETILSEIISSSNQESNSNTHRSTRPKIWQERTLQRMTPATSNQCLKSTRLPGLSWKKFLQSRLQLARASTSCSFRTSLTKKDTIYWTKTQLINLNWITQT